MSRWEVMISCWVVELFYFLAQNICLSWSIQKRNESSPQQLPELFDCLAENIRLSWSIQKRNESSCRQRPVQIVFLPTEDWKSNLSTPNQFLFAKLEFDRLKCITAYVNTVQASVSASLQEIVDSSTWRFFLVNQNYQTKIIKHYRKTR